MTSSDTAFRPFSKIPRFFREITVTEKLDGTNGQIFIAHQPDHPEADDSGFIVLAGSRNRYLTPEGLGSKGCDNFGFAAWVQLHREELKEGLGEGRHFGEWYGSGIQRGYGLTEKRFALFNTQRWTGVVRDGSTVETATEPPACCEVVPVLYRGQMLSSVTIRAHLTQLEEQGSVAVPGYMKPEGLIIYHHAADSVFKVTFDGDGPKGGN